MFSLKKFSFAINELKVMLHPLSTKCDSKHLKSIKYFEKLINKFLSTNSYSSKNVR